MFRYLFKSFWRRLLFAILIGMASRILLEVLFGLQYRNYVLVDSVSPYLGSMILAYLLTETLYWVNRWLDRQLPWGKDPKKRFLTQVLFHSIIAVTMLTTIRISYIFLTGASTFILLSDEFTINLLIIVIILALNFFDFMGVLLDQWRISLAEAEKYKKESAEFEFEMLRAQINPHFLFNSLNTLSSLVYEDRDKAAGFIRELSDVYRKLLDNRKKELVTLEEELDFIKSYIYLLELRFGQKLRVEMEIKPSSQKRNIAPLTLQMLIENAVKHNIISEKRPMLIKITADDDILVVENTLQKKEMPGRSTGMGLQNIQSRYAVLTNRKISITEDDKVFRVVIPLI